jgi:hypothetical protein
VALTTARGRRPGPVLGDSAGVLGAGVMVLAASIGSSPPLLCGRACFGAASSANPQSRFAAAGLVVAEANYGWLSVTAACLLIPLAALTLFTRSRKIPVSDVPRRVAGRPSR